MTQEENKQTFADFATLTDAELMEISGGKRHWWDDVIDFYRTKNQLKGIERPITM